MNPYILIRNSKKREGNELPVFQSVWLDWFRWMLLVAWNRLAYFDFLLLLWFSSASLDRIGVDPFLFLLQLVFQSENGHLFIGEDEGDCAAMSMVMSLSKMMNKGNLYIVVVRKWNEDEKKVVVMGVFCGGWRLVREEEGGLLGWWWKTVTWGKKREKSLWFFVEFCKKSLNQ
jgi:hypothetical protein